MPPRNGVAQINRIDSTVPLSIVFCGSPEPHRPAGEQRAEAARDLDRGEQDADRRAGQPDAVEVDDIERDTARCWSRCAASMIAIVAATAGIAISAKQAM